MIWGSPYFKKPPPGSYTSPNQLGITTKQRHKCNGGDSRSAGAVIGPWYAGWWQLTNVDYGKWFFHVKFMVNDVDVGCWSAGVGWSHFWRFDSLLITFEWPSNGTHYALASHLPFVSGYCVGITYEPCNDTSTPPCHNRSARPGQRAPTPRSVAGALRTSFFSCALKSW